MCISFISLFWYTKFSTDNIEVKHFTSERTYEWDDVEYYTLKSSQNTLVYQLIMKDGKKVQFLSGTFHAIDSMSDPFMVRFPEGDYDYAIWLTKTLKEKVKNSKEMIGINWKEECMIRGLS